MCKEAILCLTFFQKPWVVGIIGGIISGLIVFFITKWILQRKDNTKYLEQIKLANLDILRIIKPYVAEKGLPPKEIIDAIISSTARTHKVKVTELYSICIICEELIREVIENVYVSTDKKQEYSLQLKEYLHELTKITDSSFIISDITNEIKNTQAKSALEYKYKMNVILSMTMAILSLFITFLAIITPQMDSFVYLSLSENDEQFVTLIITSVCLLMSSLTFVSTKIPPLIKQGKIQIRNLKK